tara:strand:+ start:339 stop:1346 length:1008 start_codon:yes stop_codon:yes gene_type:complete
MDKVLVTGASGYIAGHCITELLKQGYSVRGSLRNMNRKDEVLNAIQQEVATENLEFCKLDLLSDEGWDDAVSDCTYVLHVASPLMAQVPKNEDEIIQPAKQGVLRALKSSVKNKIRRFVMTSSFSAVAYGHNKEVYDETHWTDPTQKIGAYNKSKAIAEKAMWDYLSNLAESEKIEATAINPTLVIGPSLSNDIGTSNIFIQKMLDGSYSVVPRIHFGFVTVKDVARAHVQAMTDPNANGKRFILSEKNMWLSEMNGVLRKNGYQKAPTKEAPNFLIKLLGLFNKEAGAISSFVGKTKFTNAENAKNILKFNFEDADVSIIETAKQLESLGLIKK